MNDTKAKIEKFLDDQYALKVLEAEQQGLHFSYVESASHFSLEDQSNISHAFQSAGYTDLIAYALEKLNQMPDSFPVSSDIDGISDFDERTSMFNYVLTSKDGKCFIVCTTEDYYIVCGTQHFVELALSKSIESAKNDFLEFAQTPGFSQSQREFLLNLLEQ